MENEKTLTREIVLYSMVFVAALALRLIYLGRIPLLESESSWALQAWRLAQGESIPVASQVGYLAVTEALFSVFTGSNFLARCWPAFAGGLLIWLPYFFREELGPVPALVLAAGLALDPALVPISRIAGSSMPALVFLALAAGAFHRRRMSWGVFFLGLGLFSGPGFWIGFLLLSMTLMVCHALGLFDLRDYLTVRLDDFRSGSESWLVEALPALLALFLIGTFFLGNFQGIGAWAGSLGEFFRSWAEPSGLGPGPFVVYLLINNPLTLVFGLLGLITAWRNQDRLGKGLAIWFGISFLGLMLYPQREAGDLIWLAVPLGAAAARELVRVYHLAPGNWVTQSLAGLVVVLASLNWLTFIGMVYQPLIPNPTLLEMGWEVSNALLLQIGLWVASLALLILAGTIVSSEGGEKAVWKGLGTGAAAALFLYLVASLSLDAYLLEKDPRSIFSTGNGSGQMQLLVDSIADASITLSGRADSIHGAVLVDSDALRWALREYENVDFLINPASALDHPFLITSTGGILPGLEENFRGQDFVLSSTPGWDKILPDNSISWIGFREGPVLREYLILWVRNDIYSGY